MLNLHSNFAPGPMPERNNMDRDSRIAAVSRGDTTPDAVADYAGTRFDSSSTVPLLKKRVTAAEQKVESSEKHRKRLEDELAKQDLFIAVPGDGVPWNWPDAIKVAFLVCVSLASLLVASNSLAVALMASGEPGFADPWRAYLFSLLPISAAAMLKFLELPQVRRQHLDAAIMATGIALALAWCGFFVLTFPVLGRSVEDAITAIVEGAFTNGQGPTRTNMALMFTGLLGEVFCAAGAWRVIDRIVGAHNVARTEPNPQAIVVEKQLAVAAAAHEQALSELGEEQAALAQQENARGAFQGDQAHQFELLRDLRAYALDDADGNGPSRRVPPIPETTTNQNGHHAQD